MRICFTWASLIALVAAGRLLSGCADIPPGALNDADLVSVYRIDADDLPRIKVVAAPGVDATAESLERFSNLVVDQLNARRSQNTADGDSKLCEVNITVTGFADDGTDGRAMGPDQGQVHLEANVIVVSAGDGGRLAEFELTRTYTWRRFEDAPDGIRDIELPFADAIAAALTGQPPHAPETIVAAVYPD